VPDVLIPQSARLPRIKGFSVKIDKGQGIGALLSTIVSVGAVVPLVWFVVQPLLLRSINTAMAQETREIVKEEIKPLSSGFRVIIQQTILRLQKEIAQLERQQRTDIGLTAEETNRLVDLRAELDAQQMALAELAK
jgi:hypothetical protein